MNHIDFPEKTTVFGKPKGMSDDQCDSLDAWAGVDSNGYPVIISKWQPTEEERKAIADGEAIWLGILAEGMPPVYLTTDNPLTNTTKTVVAG